MSIISEDIKLICPECKGTNIQCQLWVNPNNGAISDDTGRYSWCFDCEAELDCFDNLPRRKIRKPKKTT
jgi:hypothetical protein